MPQNGASWANPLLYEVEFDQPREQVTVEIYEQITAQTIGQLSLYNVKSAEIDIAPYIRSANAKVDILAPGSSAIKQSQDAYRVMLIVDGQRSDQRLFWRGDISGLSLKFMNIPLQNDTIAVGETIRLSCYATDTVEVIAYRELAGTTSRYGARTLGIPSDVAIKVNDALEGETIVVSVTLNMKQSMVYRYRVVKRDSTAVRLAWVNSAGGIEAYTFAQSIKRRVSVKAEDIEADGGWYRRIASARIVRGLVMAGATQSEVNRVLDMLLSPKVYRCDETESVAVQLLTDTILYDAHGKLHRLELDIEEVWKGGGYA